MSSLLDEMIVYFTERALAGAGTCRFTTPPGARAALFDKHTYIFHLPQSKMQMCLRVVFDCGENNIRRRYEFSVRPLDVVNTLFLRMVQEAATVFHLGSSEILLVSDENPERKRAWELATAGMVRRRWDAKRPLTLAELGAGWERVAGYSPEEDGDPAFPLSEEP